MKKLLIILASVLLPVTAYAAVFNSAQVGSSPSNGYYLKTDGSVSTWAPVSGGSGGGAGTWATTTSSVPNHLINYSLNNTDIITIGNSSTSTAKFIFDPNSQIGYFSSLVGIGTKSPNFSLEVNGEASSSKLSGAGLATCNSNTFLTWASSLFGCAADIQFSTTSAAYWLTLNRGAAYSTTSADYWLTQKTTDNLTQGSTNKYYANSLVDAHLSGTSPVTYTAGVIACPTCATDDFSTTSAAYWLTQNRGNAFSTTSADAYINASSTIAHPAGGATGNVIQWDGSKFVSVATSTLGLGGSGGGSVTSVSGSGGTTGLTLTGGPITTSGTLTLGGTLAVANGGTNASSFTTSGNSVYYNGTSLLTAPLTSAVTTPYASTTALSATTLCLTGDTCLTAWPTGGGAAYPFALSGNATSTKTQFNGGLTAYASSTIGDGTQTGGLTVSGTASSTRFLASAGTTALPAYGFLNNIGTGFSDGGASNSTIEVNLDGTEYYRFAHAGLGIGTTSPYALLSVSGRGVFDQDIRANYFTATSTSIASTLPYASTTAISVSTLTSGNCVQASTGGLLTTTGSACGAGSSLAWMFAGANNSTSTPVGFTGGIYVGTTTGAYPLTVYSATGNQLSLSNGGGVAQWTASNEGGTFYLATTTTAGNATTSPAAVQINSTGSAGLSIGTTTTTGILNLGSNGATTNATSTIFMNRIQFDGLSASGARTCAYIVGTAWVIQAGACNN